MRPKDLALLRVPSDPSLSPDGAEAAVAVTRPDLDDDVYRADLWLVATDGQTPPRRVTRGHRDTCARFSPDGRWIAFLRAPTDGGPPQLHVLPTAGGEPRALTDHPLGAGVPAWSPDSTRLAYPAMVPEEGRYGTDDDVTPDKEPPRRITTFRYRQDGIGFHIDRRPQVFVVGLGDDEADEAPEPVQLTSGPFAHGEVFWSPDGARVGFTAARHETRDTDFASDVWWVPAEGGDATRVTRTTSSAGWPAVTPDGTTVVFAGHGRTTDIVGRTHGLLRVPADGSADAERLTDAEAHDVANPMTASQQRLVPDADGVTTVCLHRGAVQLVHFGWDGQVTTLVDGPRQVAAFDRAGNVTVAVVASAGSAGELHRLDEDGSLVPLTRFGDRLARETNVRPLAELTTEADDGYPVHGWVCKPAGTGPFPVVLSVHGGPHNQYGHTLFDEAQVYAGAGYAVVMGNPRGSQGYGQAHGRAIVQAFGDRDVADVTALLDAALDDPDLDAERVGVMGGSYGGFMTSWLIGHTDRFAAAISERAVNAWDSFLGSSDIGPTFVDGYISDDPRRAIEQSPLTYAHRATTPTLVIHSEADWRCPLEQGQRLYVALKRAGVETELLLFPGEGHELSRSGLPSHRVARFEAILDWWARHLGDP